MSWFNSEGYCITMHEGRQIMEHHVIWYKSKNKWQVYITAHSKTKHLGMYEAYDEACEVRELWEDLLFGEYRRIVS